MTRILLVEDSAELRDNLVKLLSPNEVRVAATSEEALELLKGGAAFNVAIIDFWLDRGNAISVLEELKGRAAEVPVILITGGDQCFSPEVTQALAAVSGHQGFLQKPFTRSDLLAALDSALESRASK